MDPVLQQKNKINKTTTKHYKNKYREKRKVGLLFGCNRKFYTLPICEAQAIMGRGHTHFLLSLNHISPSI